MKHPIDPRDRRTPDVDRATLDKRHKRRVARSKREAPAAYAARIMRELEGMQERTEEPEY
jgi:hypothetical protein